MRLSLFSTIAFGTLAILFDLDGSATASMICLFGFMFSGCALVICVQPKGNR